MPEAEKLTVVYRGEKYLVCEYDREDKDGCSVAEDDDVQCDGKCFVKVR